MKKEIYYRVMLALAIVIERESRRLVSGHSVRATIRVLHSRTVIARLYRLERSIYGSLANPTDTLNEGEL